jgi:hypothetical protein
MKRFDVYWHIYRRDQIRPEYRGNLICVIEVPPAMGFPVVRNILDPACQGFVTVSRQMLAELLQRRHHVIIFEGVRKSAFCQLVSHDPVILKERPRFMSYNREIIHNARQFLLADPDCGLEAMSECHAQLLQGYIPGLDLKSV